MDAPAACLDCGAAWVARGGTMKTLVGYETPRDGHVHDGNCFTRVYRCAAGHEQGMTLRSRCPKDGCAWRADPRCFTHGEKVDAWLPDDGLEVVSGLV